MPATLRHQQSLAGLGQVTHDFLGRCIDDRGTYRHRQDKVFAFGASAIGAAALLPVLRLEAPGIAIVHQRIEVLVSLEIHRAAVTTITAVGATLFDELLATEAHHAVTAVAGLYKNRYFIDEFHGNASRRRTGLRNKNVRILRKTGRSPSGSRQEPHRIQKQKSPVA